MGVLTYVLYICTYICRKQPQFSVHLAFQMRRRISIRGRVRPSFSRSVRPSVRLSQVIYKGEKYASGLVYATRSFFSL